MPEGYDTHADYIAGVRDSAAERQTQIVTALTSAFARFIERREVDVITFSNMTVLDLADAIRSDPRILKPLITCCNVAGRALERDLDIRGVDTYAPRIENRKADAIAGYLKPFLPQELAVPALAELDRYCFVDKEIRAKKGRWEQLIRSSLNRQSRLAFRKRKFRVAGENFELDAAAPAAGPIEVGIDVKRIEARRDIHKRADEIVNKAAKFKSEFPHGKFAAVVYYPFTAEHVNVSRRLTSGHIDAVVFASSSEEQVDVAVGLLVDQLGIRKPGTTLPEPSTNTP